jgi:REP element-mobilizing transposase RayT
VKDGAGPRVEHDAAGTSYDADMPGLELASGTKLRCPPVSLTRPQAGTLVLQFRETAGHRGWRLLAAAVMARHVHLFAGVQDDPDPDVLLRDFKGYGSRALNRVWVTPASGTWWTESGSKRKKVGEASVRSAIVYVRDQQRALAVWIDDEARRFVEGATTGTGG